jgi:S1-C subfamily serine protease
MADTPPRAPVSAHAWGERLIPRTVMGMSVLILAFAIGSAFSGVVFYAYYEFRKDSTDKKVDQLVSGFDKRYQTALKTIDATGTNAKADIQKELEPLKKIRAEGDTLDALVKQVSPSLWFVHTLDENGQPSVGSGFVVATDANQTFILTSYTTVRAATRSPGPQVFASKGGQDVKAVVWTWQDDKDLALLQIPKGNQPKLKFAAVNPPVKTGDRVFAMSGLGAAGGAITEGFVADVSSAGIQNDAAVGPSFQGGPLVNSDGDVLAVASRSYAPLGFRPDAVWFSVPIRTACDRVVHCPSGDAASTAGDRSQQGPAATVKP